MNSRLSCRLPCSRCDQIQVLRVDDLCDSCGRASDVARESAHRQDEHLLSKAALERALGLETEVA